MVAEVKFGYLSSTSAWLSNRKQDCSSGGQKCSESLATCGIPQGSCLGLFLFIIYLKDFKYLALSKAGMYARDTCVTLILHSTDYGVRKS